ncbi:hypothetical protein [Sphingomonas sp. ID0503]|uniref:hypothetical protein n=1 Tax=Sphingomonas sp. ID0503 TaxID=3399691 RepID=UPI003AFAB3A0
MEHSQALRSFFAPVSVLSFLRAFRSEEKGAAARRRRGADENVTPKHVEVDFLAQW